MDSDLAPNDPWQPDNPWDGRTLEERSDQLADFAAVCRRLAAMLMIRGEVRAARLYTGRAVRAEELLAHGFAEAELGGLAADFPAEPAWLAAGGPNPAQPWQEQAARVYAEAIAAGERLRT